MGSILNIFPKQAKKWNQSPTYQKMNFLMFGCRENTGKTSPWLHWRQTVTQQTPAPSSAPTVANPPKVSPRVSPVVSPALPLQSPSLKKEERNGTKIGRRGGRLKKNCAKISEIAPFTHYFLDKNGIVFLIIILLASTT
jgi:hypothetical protein